MDERFGVRPLVPGTIRGVRSFKILPRTLQVISPVMTEYVWGPGENISGCHLHQRISSVGDIAVALQDIGRAMATATAVMATQLSVALRELSKLNLGLPVNETLLRNRAEISMLVAQPPTRLADRMRQPVYVAPPIPPHMQSGLECTCGFYAYHQGSVGTGTHRGYPGHGQLMGIIEGYGTVVVGTKGFRAEKARIVCFIQDNEARKRYENYRFIGPGTAPARSRNGWRRWLAAEYDEIPILPWDDAFRRFPVSPAPDLPPNDETK